MNRTGFKIKEILFGFILICLAVPGFAEFVFLKDGKIIDCKIIQDKKDSIIIEDKQGARKEIGREDILRILYTQLKMNKIFIQMRDGKGINAFLVSENRDTYTLRNKIELPDEVVLNRKDVLFIVEKNPTGLDLNGTAGESSIPLKWTPPYGQVRFYNLYQRENPEEKYKLVNTTRDKYFEVKNLKSNTTYYFVVTSVDDEDYESLQSNELKIKTADSVLLTPKNLKVEKQEIGDHAFISWQKGNENSADTYKYNIYVTVGNESKFLAQTSETNYLLKDWFLYKKIEITSIDQKNSESLPVSKRIYDGNNLILITPGLFFPLGKFGEMAGMGYGGTASFSRKKIMTERLEAGLELGFYSLPGKNFFNNSSQKVTGIQLVPFYLKAGYHFIITDNFLLIPSLAMGGVLINNSYSSWDIASLSYQTTSNLFIDPSVKAGISAELKLSRTYSLRSLMEYGLLIESGGMLGFINLGISVGYKY